MKRWISYKLNVAVLPVFFLICFAQNLAKLATQAWRWSWSETREAYRSNLRAHGITGETK